MLFNSYIFIFLFLPVTLLVFYRIGARGHFRIAIAWLVSASLFFYGWWNPAYLWLIFASLLFNYGFGMLLANAHARRLAHRRLLLAVGVGVNLAVLGYFKYFNFLLDSYNLVSGSHIEFVRIILPLGISFITFQKIAYLVDAHRGETREYDFLHFCLFVLFFPQLIAGPIVHHREVIPQFREARIYRLDYGNLAVGLTLFAFGLFKKVMIADSIALHATPVFDAAAHGAHLTLLEAWGGALAYTVQLYFDFSGYSDMAIGLARLFGVRLPVNFYSPYKAVNIIDFWRRWHITLSRFLREYLYIALGGNRKGARRRYANLLVTMLLGGLWHGAGWTFVFWGGLHGLYLVINHAWQALRRALGHDPARSTAAGRGLARLVTFLAVVFAWVFFRSESFDAALALLRGMAGLNGVLLPQGWQGALGMLAAHGVEFGRLAYSGGGLFLFVLLALAWFAPNSAEILRRYRPVLRRFPGGAPARRGRAWLAWRPNLLWLAVSAGLLLVSLTHMSRVSEFLYFQF
jgi:D-alanyl-lipoteichoic acid acyltransferase DltB (MBOAT superfamily)